MVAQSSEPGKVWSLLSSHGLVFFYLATNPESTLRQLSNAVGLTERTVYKVILDLTAADMVVTRRVGRRNSYRVNADAHFVHPLFRHLRVGAFIGALRQAADEAAAS